MPLSGFFITFVTMIRRLYNYVARIAALNNAHKIDGRVSLEDADRLYRWLTDYYEKK